MHKYVIKGYHKGVEQDQVKIGYEVARNWIWPYAYDLDDLMKIHSRPDFDPDTRHYCFLGDEMVGYIFSIITPAEKNGEYQANLDFPRMLPGHESIAERLIEKAFETLKDKGISRVVGRVTTMCPGDIKLAEKMGFSIYDWGYKIYYSYEMEWGKLDIPCDGVVEIELEDELDEYAQLAAHWYKRSPEWCKSLLTEWHNEGIITHLGVRDQEKLIAACMVAPNLVRSSTAAIYYIYAPDEHSLTMMLGKVIDKCVAYGVYNLIADLVNEHRQFEPVYQELGFKKVAEWARCEKAL
jgi:hypothetical protein